MTRPADVYTHGHGAAVLESHARRTVEDSAAYLLPVLVPGQQVLDVGCGPGSITLGLADRVAPGLVVGLDRDPGVLAQARAAAADRADVRLLAADVYALPFPDATFDVAHAHQVLQHLGDPVAALRELRRVTRPDGLVAVRDADYAAMAWYPLLPGLDAWRSTYRAVAAANGGQPDAGRRLLSWVRAAGFEPAGIEVGADVWCYATASDRSWWADTWSRRCLTSGFATRAVELGLTDDDGLAAMARAWSDWARDDDAWFVVPHAHVLARA